MLRIFQLNNINDFEYFYGELKPYFDILDCIQWTPGSFQIFKHMLDAVPTYNEYLVDEIHKTKFHNHLPTNSTIANQIINLYGLLCNNKVEGRTICDADSIWDLRYYMIDRGEEAAFLSNHNELFMTH